MVKVVKILTGIAIVAGGMLLVPSRANASEGTVEMRSTTSDSFRCFAASLRMQNLEYRIPVSCRNLVYPAGENIFSYIMWATPADGGKSIKLGSLNYGKAEFKTKTPFINLFVTTESDPKTKSPEGKIVMQGKVEPVTFLETATSPTPTPEGAEKVETQEVQKQPSTREKLFTALKRAGVAALFALFALIGLVFVITRPRG